MRHCANKTSAAFMDASDRVQVGTVGWEMQSEEREMSVDTILKERQDDLARKEAENDLLQRQVDDNDNQMVALAESTVLGQDALDFLEWVANSRRGAMKTKIEDVLTEAMQMMYGDEYCVELTYSVKNNRSHMAIEVVREIPAGEVRRDPIDGQGGGVADTISVPLRLMVMLGSRQTDRVCVLDECWKHINQEKVVLVGRFLRVLTERLGIQVLLCSHHVPLQDFADRKFFVSEIEGLANVEAF